MQMGLMRGTNQNIIYAEESNYSIVAEGTDIWPGELPFKSGDVFPTEEIKDRAMMSKTNRLIYENDVDDIYTNIISIFPEIDPMYGFQIREIITNLPLFKNATNYWVGLIAGDAPLVDVDGEEDEILARVVDDSNFPEMMQSEVRSRFLDCISAYRVDLDPNGNPVIVMIEAKNLICFVDKKVPTFIRVTVVFSIYTEDGIQYVDFVEYHHDGKIVKTTFQYGDGILGDMVGEPEEEAAFGGKFKASPVVVFKHNTINNQIYGTDQFRYWSASMLAGMRELQNVLRLGERTREMVRKVPNSAIKKNPNDGSSVFFNKGTIGYNDSDPGNDPAIEYVVPEIRMSEAKTALDSALRQISNDTQLGIVFYNIEALGSRLSAESLRASMYPAILEAKRITTEMKPAVKELLIKMGYMAGVDLSKAKVSVEFYDGFPTDTEEKKIINERLNSKVPSITLEDAIMKFDRVPFRVAKKKAKELTGDISDTDTSDEITLIQSTESKPSAGDGTTETSAGGTIDTDTAIWENQMYPKPRDIPQG